MNAIKEKVTKAEINPDQQEIKRGKLEWQERTELQEDTKQEETKQGATGTDSFSDVFRVMQEHGLVGGPFNILCGFMATYEGLESQVPELYEMFKDIRFIRVCLTRGEFARAGGKTLNVGLIKTKKYSYMHEDNVRLAITSENVFNGVENFAGVEFMGRLYQHFSMSWMDTEEKFLKLKSHVNVLEAHENFLIYTTSTGPNVLRYAVLTEKKAYTGDGLETLNDDFNETSRFN